MIRPLQDKVVLEVEKAEEKTASGIILTDTNKEMPTIGKVIAVGPGKVTDKGITPIDVKVGDRVIFEKYGNTEVEIDKQEYLIVAEDKILGVIEQEIKKYGEKD